jgi:hypothetical protein
VLFRDQQIDQLIEGDDGSGELAQYVRGAAAETLLWRERLVRDLKTGGAHVLQPIPQRMTPALISHYLEIKAQQLL